MSGRFNRRGTANNPRATSSTVCQKCLGTGHFIYECKNPRPYLSRPSRTKQLEDPKLRDGALGAREKPSVEVPEEFKSRSSKKPAQIAGTADAILAKKEKERTERKKSRSSGSSSSDSSSGSDSDSSSGSSSGSGSGSPSGSRSSSSSSSRSRSRSRTPPRRRRRDTPDRNAKESHRDYSHRRRRASDSPPPRRSASPGAGDRSRRKYERD